LPITDLDLLDDLLLLDDVDVIRCSSADSKAKPCHSFGIIEVSGFRP
jgi:hypothetical protein